MDVALLRFVGDVLAALPVGLGRLPASLDPRDGLALATAALDSGAPESAELVRTMVDAGLESILTDGLDARQAEAVLTALSDVVARRGLDRGDAGESLTPAQAAAMALMAAVIEEGTWPADADAAAAAGVLQAVLNVAMRDDHTLELVATLAANASDDRSEPSPPVEPAPSPPRPVRALPTVPRLQASPADERIAAACGLSAEAVRVLRSVIDGRRPEPITDHRLEFRARRLADLARRVVPDTSDHDIGAPLRYAAARSIVEGDLVGGEQNLSHAEDEHLRAAQQDMRRVAFHMTHAKSLRLARAELSELFGAYRRAARHMVAAMRCVPTGDRAQRTRLMIHHGRLLGRAARIGDETAASEALGVLKTAVDEADQLGDAIIRAEALLHWAEAILATTSDNDASAAVDSAMDALGSAITVFGSGSGSVGASWGLAQLRLGQAIIHQRGARHEVRSLRSAASACAAAVVALEGSGDGTDLLEARGWLGYSLGLSARYGGNFADYDAALSHLVAARQASDQIELFGPMAAELADVFAETTYHVGTRHRDLQLISAAAETYRDLVSSVLAGKGLRDQLGHAYERLAACHWHLGEQSGDIAHLVRAATALGEAIQHAEDSGDSHRGAVLRDERERLRALIEQASVEQQRDAQASA